MCIRDRVKEGAPLGTLDMGGGLAVDYDGSKTNFHSAFNYSMAELARDVVEVVGDMCSKSVSYTHLDVYKRQILRPRVNQA